MYSLYRAWFGGEDNYPRLGTLSPPDTLVRVGNEGEHQFVAHRGVLAAHSGYLKALLSTTTTSAQTDGRDDASPSVTSVSVSSVGGEAFAPLLNYMYTGRLEVTLENIYSVLLATHLLHMPGALEQCRAALLRLRGPPPPPLPTSSVPSSSSSSATTTNQRTILRPVPNRLGPPLCWSQPNLYPSGHVGLSHLSNFQLSSGLSMITNPTMIHEPATLSYSNAAGDGRNFRENTSPCSLDVGRSRITENRETSPRVASTMCRAIVDEKAVIDENDERKNKRENDDISVNDSVPDSPVGSNDRNSSTINEQIVNRRVNVESPKSRLDEGSGASTSNVGGINGVIYDIACCDGPVRFHRVLNENYVSTVQGNDAISQQRGRGIIPIDDDRDSRDVVENDENGKPPDGISTHEGQQSGSGTTSGNYTCGYCRHTFKSHYCYRKHARRHLLPNSESVATPSVVSPPIRNDARRREVRLLDLNVQYYPCKICGSKFPSYYFVHKHKKLCHANVEDTSGVGNATEGESSPGIVVAQGTSNSSDP